MTAFDPKQVPTVEVRRGQLNVDVGIERRDRLRGYCRKKKISITHCVKEMIDYCIKKKG